MISLPCLLSLSLLPLSMVFLFSYLRFVPLPQLFLWPSQTHSIGNLLKNTIMLQILPPSLALVLSLSLNRTVPSFIYSRLHPASSLSLQREKADNSTGLCLLCGDFLHHAKSARQTEGPYSAGVSGVLFFSGHTDFVHVMLPGSMKYNLPSSLTFCQQSLKLCGVTQHLLLSQAGQRGCFKRQLGSFDYPHTIHLRCPRASCLTFSCS